MIARALSFAAILWALGFAWFVVALPRPAPIDARTDVIVVLTGGPFRLQRGTAALAHHSAERMLVSGVGRGVRPADLAAQTEAAPALFGCCVDLGRDAVDTRTNADETVRWLRLRHARSARLVTTDWHMPRARYELAHALRSDGGAAVTILPDAVRSDPALTTLLNEYDKYLLRRAAGLAGL